MAAVAGIRSAHATLASGVVDTVTLSAAKVGAPASIANHGTVTIYFRTDGTDPVAAADENYTVLAGERRQITVPGSGEVRLIATGTPTYSVELG